MIKRFLSMFQSVVKAVTPKKKLECAIDEEVVPCDILSLEYLDKHPKGGTGDKSLFRSQYVGVPAPKVLEDDPWFGSAPKSQKTIHHEETVAAESQIEEDQRGEETQEPENIHQVMYEMATKNWNTVKETQGGSENFHEGPGGWNSGNGMGQFQ